MLNLPKDWPEVLFRVTFWQLGKIDGDLLGQIETGGLTKAAAEHTTMSPDSPISEQSDKSSSGKAAPSEMCGARGPHLTPRGWNAQGRQKKWGTKTIKTIKTPLGTEQSSKTFGLLRTLSSEYKPKQITTPISLFIFLSCLKCTSYQESMSV